MSIIALAQEIADDKTDIRGSAWAEYQDAAEAALAATFPDLTNAQHISELEAAIVHYMVALYYEGDIHLALATHHWTKYNLLVANYHPSDAILNGLYVSEVATTLATRFPDLTSPETKLPSAVRYFSLGRFYGRNGEQGEENKSAYFMNLFEKEISSFQPTESDYSMFVDEGKADLKARRPYLSDEELTGASYVEAVSYYARAKWFERNGGNERQGIASNFYKMYREQT